LIINNFEVTGRHNTHSTTQFSWGKKISFKFAQMFFSAPGSQGFRVFGFQSPQRFFFNPNKRKSAIPKKARPIIKEIIVRVPFIAKSNEIKDINIKAIAIIIL